MIGSFFSFLRAAVMTPFSALYTLFISGLVIFCAAVLRNVRIRDWVIARGWADPVLWWHGVRLEVRGLDHWDRLPKGFLVLFNHSSHMDIPVLFSALPKLVKFGAKVELFKIPLFGRAMTLVGALPIDRGNRSKVMKIYEQAESRLNNGEIFALAPEGTRQTEPAIGRFKRGPFEFAANAHAFIVPVTIAGAYEVFPKGKLGINTGKWTRKVLVDVGEPVNASGLEIEQLEALSLSVRAKMEQTFKSLHQELYPV